MDGALGKPLSLFDMPMLISILFFFKLFIYLGASGLSCGPWDLRCVLRVPSLWHAAFEGRDQCSHQIIGLDKDRLKKEAL